MNPEHYDRLNILKEIEGTFPGLPTPEVLDLARYVEGDASAADEEAKEFLKASMSTPRKWTNLDAIPSNVKAITDSDGERAEPQVILGKRKWVFTEVPFDGVTVTPDDGPFTEVLENE